MPDAPSAARELRLRWPTIIFTAHIDRPVEPPIRVPHLIQPRIVSTGPVSPGGACAGGLGTPAAR